MIKQKGWPRKNKYNAKRTIVDGISFSSQLESDTYCHLKLLMQAGEIGDIQLQTTVHLTLAKISYRPDFKYFDLQEKQSVWVEAKGYPTDLWKMKKRLWKHYGPGPLHIYVRGGRGTVKISEVIIPSGENLT